MIGDELEERKSARITDLDVKNQDSKLLLSSAASDAHATAIIEEETKVPEVRNTQECEQNSMQCLRENGVLQMPNVDDFE